MYQLVKIAYEAIVSTHWEAIRDLHQRHNTQCHLEPFNEQEYLDWLKKQYEKKEPFDFFLVYQEEVLIALYWVCLWEKVCFFRITHDNTYESEELLTFLATQMEQWKDSRERVMLTTKNHFSDLVAEKVGLTPLNAHIKALLKVANINWDLLHSWTTALPPNFTYTFIHQPTLEQATDIAAIHTILLNDMQGDTNTRPYEVTAEKLLGFIKQDNDRGEEYCGLLLRNEKSEAIGYSFVVYAFENPVLVKQFMTGVLPAYRRNGLGKWLKATMYLHLHQHLPSIQQIQTDYFTGNERMKNLNTLIGFEQQYIMRKWGKAALI